MEALKERLDWGTKIQSMEMESAALRKTSRVFYRAPDRPDLDVFQVARASVAPEKREQGVQVFRAVHEGLAVIGER